VVTEADEIATGLIARYGRPTVATFDEAQAWVLSVWPTVKVWIGHQQMDNVIEAVRRMAAPERLWCESCGEAEQEVHSAHAGLCGDCYGKTISEVVHNYIGDHICGHPLFTNGRLVAICALPFGAEHEHGVVTFDQSGAS